MKKKGCGLLIGLLMLCSCSEREGLAPVVESRWKAINSHAKQHEVASGETLYAIAFRYDQDYRQLAKFNHLSAPYTLRVGQSIRLQTANVATTPIINARRKTATAYRLSPQQTVRPQLVTPSFNTSARWSWPVHGRVVTRYAPQQGKKGIDIAGRKGEVIHAANAGVVAYAGNGLSGYGNLIIIKHDNQYLTAYGNNSKNLVKEGQRIHVGQTIAEMGVIDRRFWGVHFEIRKAGRPVNPLNYLQNG